MVFIARILLKKFKKPTRKYLQSNFRDSIKLFVAGGKGGNGFPKFGGVGGQGGDVKLIANENVTLNELYKSNKSKSYVAKNGTHSNQNFILGPPGETLEFKVPTGITIYTEYGKKLGELNENGQEIVVAKGGTGGNPKNGFLGVQGQAYNIILDLKLIADVGLVGFPNAGKSTLLKGISQAKPKIASYPFTTVRPNIGTIIYEDFRQITVADLPGLIEGAYANKGMGHRFLRHVERTKILLLVVDIHGFQLGPQYFKRTALETIILLNKELELYKPDLVDKPAMLLLNKMDTEGAEDKYKDLKDKLKNLNEIETNLPNEFRPDKFLNFFTTMAISAKGNKNDLESVKENLRKTLDLIDEMENRRDDAHIYEDIKHTLKERGPQLV